METETKQPVEILLDEYFSPVASNERKRNIEAILETMRQDVGFYRSCIDGLTKTKNVYVLVFYLNELQDFVSKSWQVPDETFQNHIQTALGTYVTDFHKKVPPYISRKVGKLLISIAHKSSESYPDFFGNIFQLAQSADMLDLCLTLLEVAIEELAFPRGDIADHQKEVFRQALVAEMPAILVVLNDCLTNSIGKTEDSSYTKEVIVGLRYLSYLALRCLTQLFGWTPFSTFLTRELLTNVFRCVNLGYNIDTVLAADSMCSNVDLGIQALCCLSEMITQNYIPRTYDDLLTVIFRETSTVLGYFTDNIESSETLAISTDNRFVERFIEFTDLFLGTCLKRLETIPEIVHIHLPTFIIILRKFTFMQTSHIRFCSCLKVWCTMIDHILMKDVKEDVSHTDTWMQFLTMYDHNIVALAHGLFKKLLFKYNRAELESLKSIISNDVESMTAFEVLRQASVDVICKIFELKPEISEFVFPIFDENLMVYEGLSLQGMPCGNLSIIVSTEEELQHIYNSLQDLTLILYAFGCLVDTMCDQLYAATQLLGMTVLQRLCTAAVYGNNRGWYYEVKWKVHPLLRGLFIEVHSHMLTTLRAFCPWMLQYRHYNQFGEADAWLPRTIMEKIPLVIIPSIRPEAPERIIFCAANFLLTFTLSIHPKKSLLVPIIHTMFQLLSSGVIRPMKLEVQSMVYRSLSLMMSMPDTDNTCTPDYHNYKTFLDMLCSSLNKICDCAPDLRRRMAEKVEGDLVSSLKILYAVINDVVHMPIRQREIFFYSLEPVIVKVEQLIQLFDNRADIYKLILDLHESLFSVFRLHACYPLRDRLLDSLLSMCSSTKLVESYFHNGPAGVEVLERVLKFFHFVVLHPTSVRYLHNILHVCIEYISPALLQYSSSDIATYLFMIFHVLLLQEWKHFFGSSGGITDQQTDDVAKNIDVFIHIMEAFATSFQKSDINIFKHNLAALESVNGKWKLYHKKYFRNHMLSQFLIIFLKNMIQKTHTILDEDMTLVVYNMASVDFCYFFQGFLPSFLETLPYVSSTEKQTIVQHIKQDTDMPTFERTLHTFIKEIQSCHKRFYQ